MSDKEIFLSKIRRYEKGCDIRPGAKLKGYGSPHFAESALLTDSMTSTREASGRPHKGHHGTAWTVAPDRV